MAGDSGPGGTDVGRRIRERREALGLSLEESAGRAGMSVGYLAYLEQNPGASPTSGALARLAAALDTSTRVIAGAGVGVPPGQGPGGPRPVLEALGARECRAFLGDGGVGRALFDEDTGPAAAPVNFKMLGDDIVFRTAAGSPLAAAAASRRVSFEVDHLDEAQGEGWSVLVAGDAHVVSEPGEAEQVASLGITPWAGGDRDTYVRITPAHLTGRRIRVAR